MSMPLSRQQLLAKAYSAADKELRRRHADEFHDILAEQYVQMGLTVRKRLTGERKNRATIAELKERIASLENDPQG